MQEAADYLGADCVARSVEMKQMQDLDFESILQQSNKVLPGLDLIKPYYTGNIPSIDSCIAFERLDKQTR